jgi:hypothetical protein
MGEVKQTNGAVQGVCSASVGLLQLLIAFIGYTAFTGNAAVSPWRPLDLVHLVFALFGAVALLSVPWVATRGSSDYDLTAINRARLLYAWGSACTLIAIVVVLGRSFFGH